MRLLKLSAFIVLACAINAQAQAPAGDKAFEDNLGKYLATEKGQEAILDAVQKAAMRQQQQSAQKQMEEQFKNPVSVDIGNSPIKGPKDAKVTIAEFSDFQCPFCKRGHDTMKQVSEAYGKDVRIVFKHRPLPFHDKADGAARATIAAGNQDKFWEMADALFANQQKLGDAFYEEQAKTLGLNLDKFKSDLNAPATTAMIKADQAQGDKLNVNGTPGFFVNGVSVPGAQPLERFKMVIDKVKNNPAPAAKVEQAAPPARK